MAVNLELARKRFKYADDAEHNQRAREKEDLGFYEGEAQWPEEIKALRAGQQANGNFPAVPARPCLTINKVRDPIRRIQNDELQADLGMSIIPADDFGGEIEESEIELREGLARRIQRQSNAKDARMWAANRAAISGRGWYGISTQWVESDSFDQEIIYERFYDQFSVLADPAHEQPDGSDIEYAFVGRDVPWDIYRDEYPNLANGRRNPLANANTSDSKWRAFADEAPGWLNEEGDARSVRVTRYWRYERERYDIVLMDDGQTVMPADVLPADVLAAIPEERRRERVIKRVKSALIDGVNVLEETDWPGKFIPLIKVVGEEIHVFDKERRYEGLVRPARDPQKSFNAMVSTAVETIALAPKSPWLIPAAAVENYEDMWKQSAVRNWPYLPYNAIDPSTQQPIQPPQRNQAEPPIQAMALMIGAFEQGIMATIGQANLADTHPDVRSGQMASRLIDEAARGTSNYLSNLIRSVHYEGAIVNDLLYPIYGIRPGRIVSMMNSSQKTERVMVGKPFVTPNGNGMPQPHDPMNPQQQGMKPKEYRLTKDGSFNVAIEVSKFYETKQQEKLSLLAGLIEKSPDQLGIMGDRFMELAGDDELAQRYKAVLIPPVQEMLAKGKPPDPQLQQSQELLRGLSAEMTQLKADKHARIEQAAIKAQSDQVTSQMDNATKLQIAQSHDAVLLAIEELKSGQKQQAEQVKLLIQSDKARQEEMRTVEAFMEERRLSEDRAHEVGMQHLQHQHTKDELEHEARVFPPSPNGSGE